MTQPTPVDWSGSVYATTMSPIQSVIDSVATQLATVNANANATGKTALQNACSGLQSIASVAEAALGQTSGTFAPSGGWGKGDHH